ncbi:glycosyltransferase family 2 protein [Sutterella sp.]|uniref:glycosyltransferase family 2 protein n=1 Tax=Sutterella sp. TaxID=1981025 RepID=UPI003FD6E56B
MKDIAVSIILPIYDVELYLDRCIQSIRDQDLFNIEIILASDGPEQCDSICKKYAKLDDRVQLVMHPGSYGKAFNKALEIAKGEYIGIVETDDWCDSRMFSRLYSCAKSYDADVVKGGFIEAFDEPKLNRVRRISKRERCIQPLKYPHLLSFQPSVWSAIYKKEFLIKNRLHMIEERMSFIDAPFSVMTFLAAEKVILLPDANYYYYQCNPNQSIKKATSFDGLRAEEWLYDNLEVEKLNDYVKNELIASTIRRLKWNSERLENSQDFVEKCTMFFMLLIQRLGESFVLCDPKVCHMAKSIGFPEERLHPPRLFGVVRSSGRIKIYFGNLNKSFPHRGTT